METRVEDQGLETVRVGEHANLLWVQLHTDSRLVGLGETFFGARAVEAWIHETAAPLLLGKNRLEIDHISRQLIGYLGFTSTGAEMRDSAIDIAL